MTIDQLNQLYAKIAEELDISDTLFERAETSYRAVGEYIGHHTDCIIDVYTQGSFRLGTVIRPLNDEDDYDLDLVCEYTDGQILSPKALKLNVGNILRDSKRYSSNLTEKKRCWRIDYADEAQFHMDITPAVPPISNRPMISVTDKISTEAYSYSPSNPKGYAEWFYKKNVVTQKRILEKAMTYDSATIEPVKRYGAKTPLQKAIQILKRHRDKMFEEFPDIKPISIIITTLSAQAYRGDSGVYDAVKTILETMHHYIGERNNVYSILNPSLPSENFAEKWNNEPKKAKAFFDWLRNAKQSLITQPLSIIDSYTVLENALGETIVGRAVSSVDTKADSSSTALAPYKNQTVQVALKAPHRKKPPFKLPKTPTLTITAMITHNGKQYAYNNNGTPIPKNSSIDFKLIGSAIVLKGGYTVKWQVVNTGNEAELAGGLRGGFETCENKTTWHESTMYTGIHYVQAFLLKRNSCLALSREFIVHIQ